VDHGERGVAAIKDRYLTFEMDSELYGVEILSVKEIIGFQKTVNVPRMPVYVKGVMNLRGTIIPVIDLRMKLGMKEEEITTETAIIIVILGNIHIGFVVDRVKDVAAITGEELKDAPNFGSKVNASFIKNMANLKDSVVMILDIEAIFGDGELASLEGMVKEKRNTQDIGE